MSELGGGTGNDSWGWKDPETGRYYAIMGRSSGTSFVDVTEPVDPVFLGDLPTNSTNAFTRDIKVHANHAFIVSDARNHGMQVFDLTHLRDVTGPESFSADAVYLGLRRAHNIAINEQTGFAYLVSGNGTGACSGGLHIVDISEPKSPVQAGCYEEVGDIHDTQCVVYQGPDPEFQGAEICFASNNPNLSIIDVSNKNNPVLLGQVSWPDRNFAHQGWLTEDQKYFLMGDEGDESAFEINTRTLVHDVSDLRQPVYVGAYLAGTHATDHNQYVKGDFVYQANLEAGLRILHIDNLAAAQMSEVGFFDTWPEFDGWNAAGPWSVYPFFDNGTIIVSDINKGLFLLRASLGSEFHIDAGLNGNWWNGPDRNGEGVQVEVSDGGDGSLTFVATFYSYDTVGKQIFLIAVGTVNGDTVEVDVFITDGGLWGDDFDPALVNETQWGTGRFTASSCEAIHMELIPNAIFQGMGFTTLVYDLIRLTTPSAPCPVDDPN
jgi:choice-of-anchor B domain-containing protein